LKVTNLLGCEKGEEGRKKRRSQVQKIEMTQDAGEYGEGRLLRLSKASEGRMSERKQKAGWKARRDGSVETNQV
jgi:hypothetical protein